MLARSGSDSGEEFGVPASKKAAVNEVKKKSTQTKLAPKMCTLVVKGNLERTLL